MKYQILQLTTDGDDFSNMFDDINSLIEKHDLFKSEMAIYQFHLDMVELFGKNWRTAYYHVIDNSYCDRLKYFNAIRTNIFRDCDPGFDKDFDAKEVEVSDLISDTEDKARLEMQIAQRDTLTNALSKNLLHDLNLPEKYDFNLFDDEIQEIINTIDKKNNAIEEYYSNPKLSFLEKIDLLASFKGHQFACDLIEDTIERESIKDAYYYLKAHQLNLGIDNIAKAEEWITRSQALGHIPLNIHLEFMFFYVRFDHGYRQIAEYAARILPLLNEDEKRSLVPFLLKQMDVGYLDKNDLSPDVLAEIVLYQNKLN